MYNSPKILSYLKYFILGLFVIVIPLYFVIANGETVSFDISDEETRVIVIADKLSKYGIKGIWNFTSSELDTSKYGVKTENVHLGDSLMTLCYQINNIDNLDEQAKWKNWWILILLIEK
mgnify:CR=1 FL=1